jgi:hypothetical protein
MLLKLGYALVCLSAIPRVLSENLHTLENDTPDAYHEASAESTAPLVERATFSDSLTRAYEDGLSSWGIHSASEPESFGTTLSSQSPVGTMALSDLSYDVDGSTSMYPSSQTSNTQKGQDAPSTLWIAGSAAYATPTLGSIPTSSNPPSSPAAYSQESADLAQNDLPPSDPEQATERFYYTEDGEWVPQVGMICTDDVALNASSSAATTTLTSTSASSKASTSTTSSTHCSQVASTTSAWDPFKAALNWLTEAPTSTSSSCKGIDLASISTTDPAQLALDWLTSATQTAGLDGTGTLSTTTTDSRYSGDASATVASLEATHTSYAAAGRLRPGFW